MGIIEAVGTGSKMGVFANWFKCKEYQRREKKQKIWKTEQSSAKSLCWLLENQRLACSLNSDMPAIQHLVFI